MRRLAFAGLALLTTACATPSFTPTKEGLVEYGGAQKHIFATGRADPLVPVAAIAADSTSFGVGAVSGLDGEITVLAGKAYIAKVRGGQATIEQSTQHAAVFAVWTRQARWSEQPVPAEVKTYADLQRYVKARAQAAGIDTGKPFPFLLAGTPLEVKWHVNVDRTQGQAITPELFTQSKAGYVLRGQAMDIVGFYSEAHPGVFISQFAPGIKPGDGVKNAIHIHTVTQGGQAAGHIDDIVLGPGMTLKLPATP